VPSSRIPSGQGNLSGIAGCIAYVAMSSILVAKSEAD